MLTGLARSGGCKDPQENVLANAIALLVASKRVYRYGNNIVLGVGALRGDGQCLLPLRTEKTIEPNAEDWLSNLFICEDRGQQFPPPRWFIELTLTSELLWPALPQINVYSPRPLFDQDFILRGPGFHAERGILIHGPAIEPSPFLPPSTPVPALDRLPPNLRTLLHGFCFRSDADVANVVALMITGLLINHFVLGGKPIGLFDGNQPSTGKSWLARVLGIVLDGVEPMLLFYTADDEELQKRICAKLRERVGSVLIIDNAKLPGSAAVSSPVIESLSVAPEVSLRVLGTSTNYTGPNDLLWLITMNDTRTSPDLVSRGVPVQLYYEGRPEDRVFDAPDPIEFAREHRLEILGELAGMIVRWVQQGRPHGTHRHRLQYWARVIGGIMGVAGFPEFLSNAQEAAASFNSASDELAALAEAVVVNNGPFIVEGQAEEPHKNKGSSQFISAMEWESSFQKAKIKSSELETCKSAQSKAIRIGKFLGQMVGSTVPIQVHGRQATAELQVDSRRAREKRYGFLVRWDPVSSGTKGNSDAKLQPARTASGTSSVGQKPAKTTTGLSKEKKTGRASKGGSSDTRTANARQQLPVVKPVHVSKGDGGVVKNEAAGNSEPW